MTVRIFEGDCRDILRTLPDESVHCIVTSPPYFGLRDYGVDGQMGLEATPEEFVAGMVAVFAECRRVLRDDGVMFLNIGDSYSGSGKGGGGSFESERRGWRATPCDTSGKEPASSQSNDCLCENLCDVCREAYRIGKSHSDSRHAPMLRASQHESSRPHRESQSGRAPTSGSKRRADRSECASSGLKQEQKSALLAERAVLESTTRESDQPRQADCRQSARSSECLVCARSLPHCAPESARKAACNFCTSRIVSENRISRMGASGWAYGNCKPKDLIGIPWMLAFALRADGWYLRQDIIWAKPNPMPESVTDRCTKSHEYLFLLTKSSRYYFDANAIRTSSDWDPAKSKTPDGWDTSSGSGSHGSFHRSGREKGKRCRGLPPRHSQYESSDQSNLDTVGRGLGANKRSVWSVATQPFKEAHFATFPPALVEPCILAGCPQGGVCLDPFGGAGTTGLVADRLQRDAILIELNPEYAEIARRRITGDSPLFAEVA